MMHLALAIPAFRKQEWGKGASKLKMSLKLMQLPQFKLTEKAWDMDMEAHQRSMALHPVGWILILLKTLASKTKLLQAPSLEGSCCKDSRNLSKAENST